jgi:hypothetical protein
MALPAPLPGTALETGPTHERFVKDEMTRVVLNEKGQVRSLRAYGNPADLYRHLGLSK